MVVLGRWYGFGCVDGSVWHLCCRTAASMVFGPVQVLYLFVLEGNATSIPWLCACVGSRTASTAWLAPAAVLFQNLNLGGGVVR